MENCEKINKVELEEGAYNEASTTQESPRTVSNQEAAKNVYKHLNGILLPIDRLVNRDVHIYDYTTNVTTSHGEDRTVFLFKINGGQTFYKTITSSRRIKEKLLEAGTINKTEPLHVWIIGINVKRNANTYDIVTGDEFADIQLMPNEKDIEFLQELGIKV